MTTKNNSIDSSPLSNKTAENHPQPAEKKLKPKVDVLENLSREEASSLVHELQVQNQKLLKKQTLYFDLFDQAPVGYLTLNSKGLIIESNSTAAKLLGVKKTAMEKKSLSDFIAPEHQDIFNLHFQQLFYGSHSSCDLRVLRADNKQCYISLESAMVTDDKSEQANKRFIASDITKRKRAEIKLQNKLSRLQAMVNTATNAIITIDCRGIVLMFNAAAETMFGYSARDIVGHKINRIMPSPYFEEHDTYIANYLKTGQAKIIGKQREINGQRKDGSIFPLSLNIAEFNDGGDGDDGLFFTGILQDISERRRAEEAIRESEHRLALVLHASKLGFWDWDILNHQTIYNTRWYEMLGLKEQNADDYSEQFFTSLIHKDDRERVLTKLKQTLEGSGLFQSEHRLLHSDGHYFWIQENGMIVKRNQEGQPMRMVGSFVDISERKLQEQHKREHQHDYERLLNLEVANQTIAAIAHELNQPLNAAASYTDAAQRFLQKEQIKDKKSLYALEQSVQQIKRAGNVVHELFSFLNARESITTPLGLNNVITNVIALLKDDGFLGDFKIKLELAASLPLVMANDLQLEKVLTNLIRNGVEAMNDAGLDQGSIVVTVTTADNNSYALVSICDSGPGLASESTQKVFEPFYSTKANGLGMGLAISRALIEAQGGQLWCQENEGGRGVTFYLTIPFAAETTL